MIHAGAPKSMWVEAARYANNVTQFVPSASPKMEGLSPYESLHKEMPPMHQLHTWGCLAFVNIPGHVVRYGEKGRPAAFVGLALNNNDGYRFYDGETKTIFHAKATPADFRENTSYFKWKKYKSAKEGLILDLQKARSSYAKDVHTANRFSDLEDLPGSISEEEEDVEPDEELVREPRARVPSLAAIESLGAAYLTQHEKTEEAMVSVTTSIVRKLHRKAHKMKHQENKGFSNMKPRAFRSNLEKYASALEARGTVKRLPSGSVPSTAWEALSSVDKHLWIEAMLAEIKSHQINKTMEGIRRNKVPPGRKLIKARWVFDLKRNEEGMVVRYKARLVAKGYLQRHGLDYTETFAPTPMIDSIRYICALALTLGFVLRHQDVKTAFLIPPLPTDERVYVEPPVGLEMGDDYCYELIKCIYGLKQAAHYWHEHVKALLVRHNFTASPADDCVFIHRDRKNKIDVIIAVHVDDLLIACKEKKMNKVSNMLSGEYEMTDLGQLSWYLGIKFEWSEDSVALSQEAFINALLEEQRMTNSTPFSTPASKTNMRMHVGGIAEEERKWLEQRGYTQTAFRGVVGSLQYLCQCTRPDIAYAVGQLSRFQQDARREQWVAVRQVLKYLKGTKNLKLKFKKGSVQMATAERVVGWSDSDWAGCKDTRASTSGYAFTLAGGAVSWKSKKQPGTPARSSAEAELIALDLAWRHARWLRKLESGFDIGVGSPTTIHEDNEAAIAISAKHQRTQRTKHIDVEYFAICGDVKDGRVKVSPVASKDNMADIFTKGLERIKFEKFRSMLGLAV